MTCAVVLFLSTPAPGAVDAPAVVRLDFHASQTRWTGLEELPADLLFDPVAAQAYLSTDASGFGDSGVLLWASFELEAPGGRRNAILLLDLDTGGWTGVDHPLDHPAVRAEYLETRGDQVLFHGEALAGEAWIVDLLPIGGDQDLIEGDFAMIFADPDRPHAGSRVLVRGTFYTEPSPASERIAMRASGEPADTPEREGSGGEEFVEEVGGCTADFALGCAAEVAAGALASGCEGDTGDGAGCEGDTYETASMRLPALWLPALVVLLACRSWRRRK
jgi:hypothetical protein